MRQGRLILTLEKFSEEECLAFLQFVKSPYFNTNEKATKLLEYILESAPDFEEYTVIAQKAEVLIFEGKAPKGGFAKLTSYLAKLSEKFISIQDYKDNVFAEKLAVANFAFSRKEEGLYQRSVKELKKVFVEETQYDIDLYYDVYRFEEFLANCNFIQNPLLANKHTILAKEAADAFFLTARLRLATAQRTYKNITEKELQEGMMQNILVLIEERQEELPVLVKVWYKAFQLANNPSSRKAYTELRQEFSNNIPYLNPKDAYGILSILQNYQARTILSQEERIVEMFSLYRLGLEHELLYAEGYILPGIFNNIVTVSLRLGELVWVGGFISRYEQYLPQEHRKNVIQYNQARLAFEKQDFKICKRLLNQLDFHSVFVTLGIKRMQLKVYFELREEELLENSLNAFRVYLHRLKKLAVNHKDANLNFLNAVSTLCRFYDKAPTPEEKVVCTEELAAQANLHEQQWLIRKVKEF